MVPATTDSTARGGGLGGDAGGGGGHGAGGGGGLGATETADLLAALVTETGDSVLVLTSDAVVLLATETGGLGIALNDGVDGDVDGGDVVLVVGGGCGTAIRRRQLAIITRWFDKV
ncbi:hypothetical protein PInf_005068 [Phytophthora infestans]|nr:hypothetical protein PInf_005068 [Phytophthora infestans]